METTQAVCTRSWRLFIICNCCHTLQKLIFICGTSDIWVPSPTTQFCEILGNTFLRYSFSGRTMRTEAVNRQLTQVDSYWASVHAEFFSDWIQIQQTVISAVYLFIVLLLWTVGTVLFQLFSTSLKQSVLIICGRVELSFEVEADSGTVPLFHQVACVSLMNDFELLVLAAFLLMAGRDMNGRQHNSDKVGKSCP
jgi:hypothetical protein